MKQYIIRLLFKVDASGLKKQLQSISKEAARVGAAMAKSMNRAFKTVAKQGGDASKQVVKSLDNIDRKAKTSSKNITTNFKKVDDQMDGLIGKARQLAVGLVSVFAGQKLVSGIRTSIDNFARLEIGLAKLQAAANSFGADFKTIRDDLIAIRKEGVLSFETLNYVARQLVTPAIGVASDEVGNFIKALRNIAAVEGIYEDLDFSITSFVRGLQTGTAELLENLSPRIRAFIKTEAGGFAAVQKDQASRQKLFNELLKSGNQLQGAYEELLDSTTFKTQQLNVASKELSETIGQGLAPAYNLLIDVLTESTKSMTAYLESMTIAERATKLLAGSLAVLLGGLLGFLGGAAGGGPIGAVAGGLAGLGAGASLAFGEIGEGIQDFIRSKQKLSDIVTELSGIQTEIQKLQAEDAVGNAEEINRLKEQELNIQTEILNRIRSQDSSVDKLRIAYRNVTKEQLEGLKSRARLERSLAAKRARSSREIRTGALPGIITGVSGRTGEAALEDVKFAQRFLRQAEGAGGVGAKEFETVARLLKSAAEDLKEGSKATKEQKRRARQFQDLFLETFNLQVASVIKAFMPKPITSTRSTAKDGGRTPGQDGMGFGGSFGNILPPGVTFAGRQEIRQQEIADLEAQFQAIRFERIAILQDAKEELEKKKKEAKKAKESTEAIEEQIAARELEIKAIQEGTDEISKANKANLELNKRYIEQTKALDDLTSVFKGLSSSVGQLKKGGLSAVEAVGSLTKGVAELLPKGKGLVLSEFGSQIGLGAAFVGLVQSIFPSGNDEYIAELKEQRKIQEAQENYLKTLVDLDIQRQKSERSALDRQIDAERLVATRQKEQLEATLTGDDLQKEQIIIDQETNDKVIELLQQRLGDLGFTGELGTGSLADVSQRILQREQVGLIIQEFQSAERVRGADLTGFRGRVRGTASPEVLSILNRIETDFISGMRGGPMGFLFAGLSDEQLLDDFAGRIFKDFIDEFSQTEDQTAILEEQYDVLKQIYDLETNQMGLTNDLLQENNDIAKASLTAVQPRGFGAVDVSRGGLAFGRDFIPTAASLISNVGVPAQIGNLAVAAEANKTMDQKILDSLQSQLNELKVQTNLLAQLTNTDARIVIANAQAAVKATGF